MNCLGCLAVFCIALSCVTCNSLHKMKCQGFCMKSTNCPTNPEASEYCPNENEVCCYGIDLSEVHCKKRGGECTNSCPQLLRDLKAQDCPTGQHCCIFVH